MEKVLDLIYVFVIHKPILIAKQNDMQILILIRHLRALNDQTHYYLASTLSTIQYTMN
jgi:hypothetical protein